MVLPEHRDYVKSLKDLQERRPLDGQQQQEFQELKNRKPEFIDTDRWNYFAYLYVRNALIDFALTDEEREAIGKSKRSNL